MPIEKLYTDRVVVLGQDYNDARLALKRTEVTADDDVTIVSASSHSTAILGGVAGMRVARIYVTPAAHRGANYDLARRALQACADRAGITLTHLDGDGGTYASL